jgi:hypothetical protein
MTAGRSLRLLLAVGLALAVWLALRLPLLQRDLAALQAEPATLLPPPGAGLPQPAAGLVPVAMRAPPDVAVAAAEVAVAEAALALARAQLQLAQVRAGGAMAPLPALAMAPPAYAPGAAPQRLAYAPPTDRAYAPPYRAYAPRPSLAPGWTLPLPAVLPPQTAATPPVAAMATPTTAPVSPAPSPGHDLATAAYARLAAGDRRGAVALFDTALASDPVPGDAKLRPAWTAERRRLVRRWSADAYTLFRESGPAGPAASPVLGGGQSGGTLAWTYDPLARRPLALVARYNAASLGGRIDPATGQAAFGVRWQPVTGVSISAERLVSAGVFARDDWALRVAGGAEGKRGRTLWSGYGEAGVLGAGDVFAGGQVRAGVPVLRIGKLSAIAGPGGWASLQHGSGVTSGRFDLGPSLLVRAPIGRASVELSADWRFQLAGNALPGSGPALTLSTGF